MSMTQDEMKKAVAAAAVDYVEPGMVVGIGTGSTANYFIDELAKVKHKVECTVASSVASADRLKSHGIVVEDLNAVDEISIYVDGADESTEHLHLIKGGGGALTREKIVAAVSKKFICIADESKLVDILGKFPLPIEVIPMARSYVGRQLVKLGGQPQYRAGVVTDNGNLILDVHNLQILDAVKLETELNQVAGVVCNGLFARRPADVLLVGTNSGVQIIK